MPSCKFTKKLLHTSFVMYFVFIFSECITINFSEEAFKVHTFKASSEEVIVSTISFRKYKWKVVLLVIYLFSCDSSKHKSTFFMLNMAFDVLLSRAVN